MNLRRLRRVVPYRLLQLHDIPKLEGRQSRTHRNVPAWRMQAEGAAAALQHRDRLNQVQTLVQFAGFPRSGHSLIGSILDAHPDARVAHELDAMGLIENKIPMRSILGLIDKYALMFSHHGRYWNGYCYYVEGGAHESERAPVVMGDKKGDMAVRRIARDPALLHRLAAAGRLRKKWICVLRNPYDNIATMSLRKNALYDTLRATTASSGEFRKRLLEAQQNGEIAQRPRADQIDDYSRLCEAVATIQQATPADDWFELAHEEFAEKPGDCLRAMCTFLGLAIDEDYIARCAALVHPSANRSRTLLTWSDDDRARVESLIDRYPFLAHYRDTNPT